MSSPYENVLCWVPLRQQQCTFHVTSISSNDVDIADPFPLDGLDNFDLDGLNGPYRLSQFPTVKRFVPIDLLSRFLSIATINYDILVVPTSHVCLTLPHYSVSVPPSMLIIWYLDCWRDQILQICRDINLEHKRLHPWDSESPILYRLCMFCYGTYYSDV